MTTTEMFLKYLISFPVAVVIIALVVIFVLRKPLTAALQRGGVKIGKEGLSIDAVAAAAGSAQSEATPIDNSLALKPDPNTDKRLASVTRVSVPVIVREQEDRIRAELVQLNFSDNSKDAVDLLIQHLALSQLYHAAERLYRLIFGSQIAVLKSMNLRGPLDRNQLRSFYDTAAAIYPLVYDKYPFEAYINFLKTNNLIVTTDDTRYSITHLGKDFLQWMVVESVSDAKAF
jgi:hypothetical protein